MHVVAEGRINDGGCSYEQLRAWLTGMPQRIGMTRISPAIVEWRPPLLLGMVLLAESHCAVHMDFSLGRFWADVFTCRAFNVPMVLKALAELNVTVQRSQTLERGLEYLATDDASPALPEVAGTEGDDRRWNKPPGG